ncbi:TonB-dependent receptor domain-containing protein [Porphyrobacter sp. CACIAM 03H1]|uniref:TonB-dependent receptor domain-containing protein n=1 Tax=Porphyrobacter sp. CACIAM 03H1 TaxID=2003315 RepID=UPI000B5A3CD8|nr:TonB-dependent receptor [Porphyrobacter sp. CACIAM 03H1]ASJ90500.1 TonB-dependent receptor [Porphyrobacter sp. CACIAM 03H1]
MKLRYALCAGAAASALLASPAFAQDAADAPVAEGEEIIVTAVARGQNRIESSVSVSTIGAQTIANLAAPSSADLIRQIPGIRSEASGGEGNANIAVRGIPVSTGGARYIQLQEDGLPILEFGDIIFGNADNFLRADRSVARVEAVRGGSASTFASNAPGAVINFISKTGQQEGGAIQASVGLDFESYRLDFDYGAPLAEDLYFHVGGFYRTGEGPRDIGYNGYDGGQIKANITKEFDGGYIRFHAKYLDDRTPTILPQPVRVTGTGGNPDYQAIPGFDPRRDSLYSPFLGQAVTLDGNNNPASYDFRDGLSVKSLAFGIESEIDVGSGWTLTNRFRFADNSGGFLSPFPAGAGAAQAVANSVGGAGSSIIFASGPNAGQLANAATIGGNGLLANVVNFNVRLSLDNVTNDFRVNKAFDIGGGTANFTTGFYLSRQTIDTDWLWTSHLQTVQGDGQAVLVNVRNAGGQLVTQNGTVGFGASFFGNCCRRSYDVDYSTYAPFASLSLELDRLTIDASIRYDFGDASGTITGADSGFGVGVGSFDFDRNGTISPAEAQTSVLPLGNARPVNYEFDYLSFSLGANYLVTDDLGVFARYSRGGRHTADRSLFSPAVSAVDGGLPGGDAGVIARVDQLEAGLKYQSGGLALYATGFYAETSETNVDIAPLVLFDTTFEAYGIELEGSYRSGPFSLTAGATWTDAEIKDALNAATIGNTPRRQADLVYQATAQYDADLFTVGANIVGTTESFTQDNNDLILPAFAQVNAFVAVRPIDRIEIGLNATNLFNATGFTEAEEGSIPANGLVRARSIAGRTVLASVRFDF